MVVVMMVMMMLLRKSGARNEHDQGEQQCFFHVPMITTSVVGGCRNFCVTPHHSCRLHGLRKNLAAPIDVEESGEIPGPKRTLLDGTLFRWTEVQLPLLKLGAPTSFRSTRGGCRRIISRPRVRARSPSAKPSTEGATPYQPRPSAWVSGDEGHP
jgi:hypothetical protein